MTPDHIDKVRERATRAAVARRLRQVERARELRRLRARVAELEAELAECRDAKHR